MRTLAIPILVHRTASHTFVQTYASNEQTLHLTQLTKSNLCLQNAGVNAASKAEPTKRAQRIEPVLRQAPKRKAPQQVASSNAAAYVPAHSNANLTSGQPAKAYPASVSAGLRGQHSSLGAEEALYRQQIQSALRDESPEVQTAASQKRPTAKVPARKPKALSPVQQAQQDLTERSVPNTLLWAAVHATLLWQL